MTVERRVYTKEFKEQVVMLIETSGKSVGEIAKDLGIRENNLWRWRKEFREAGANSFPGHGNRRPGTDLEEENRVSKKKVQYTCKAYQKLLKKHHLVCSMSRKGNCWDNAVMESFFSTLKTECIAGKIYLSRAQVKREIFEFIEIDYNRNRRHSAIDSMTPKNFENQRKSA